MKKGPGEFRPERCAYRWQEHWKKRAGENDRFYEMCEVRIVDCQISGGFSTCSRSGLQISVAVRVFYTCAVPYYFHCTSLRSYTSFLTIHVPLTRRDVHLRRNAWFLIRRNVWHNARDSFDIKKRRCTTEGCGKLLSFGVAGTKLWSTVRSTKTCLCFLLTRVTVDLIYGIT